jgi:hypothetical protein
VIKLHPYFSQIHLLFKRYVKGNWGYPFIAGFIVLLSASAVLLAAGTTWAESMAKLVYFSLVIGVALQLIRLGRSRIKNGAVFHGSD